MAQIIHVISSGGLYGAERSILGLIKSVREYQHQVVCFNKSSGSHTPFVKALEAIGVPVTVLPDGYGALRENARKIIQLSRRDEPLHLHAHGYKGTISSCCVRSIAPNTRVVCTQHGFTNKSLKTRTFTKLETRLIKSARVDHVICASNLIRSFYLGKNVPAEKLTYIANAVEVSPDLSEVADWRARDINFLYLGRLSPEKGPDILLDALAAMKMGGTDTRLSIAGDGPMMEPLKQQVQDSNLSTSVDFLGFVSDPAPLLKRARWLVLPSLTEGLPMSALEAMSHGTPLIASAVGELPNLIGENHAGLLVPPGNPSALVETMRHSAQLCEPDWEKFSQFAFETVSERFTLERYGQEVGAIYSRIFSPNAYLKKQSEVARAVH